MQDSSLSPGPAAQAPGTAEFVTGMEVGASFSRRLIARIFAMDHAWSLVDQAMVSGTSFLTLLFVARWSGAEQAGIYAVGASATVLLIALQDSLVTRPYSIQLHRRFDDKREHAMAALLLTAALALITMVAALGLAQFFHGHTAARIVGALAFAMPAILVREFVRRFAFANLLLLDAVAIDGAISVIVLCGLAWLGHRGQLSAASAFAAVASATACAVAIWFVHRRGRFRFGSRAAYRTARESWRMGRWLMPSRLALEAQGYVTHWIALMLGGAVATGIYAACLSVLALANPFLSGVFNLLTPKAARVLDTGGMPVLWAMACRYAAIIGIVMTIFAIVIAVFGESIMALMFPAGEFGGHGDLLAVLSVSFLVAPVGLIANVALICVDRSRAVATVSLVTLVGSVPLIVVGMLTWGLAGAGGGVVAAETFNAAILWFLFHRMFKRNETGR